MSFNKPNRNERKDQVMSSYKVVLRYSDGETYEEDVIFDTEEEAFEHGEYLCGCAFLGDEILYDSNPGDYPLEDDGNIEIEVVKID